MECPQTPRPPRSRRRYAGAAAAAAVVGVLVVGVGDVPAAQAVPVYGQAVLGSGSLTGAAGVAVSADGSTVYVLDGSTIKAVSTSLGGSVPAPTILSGVSGPQDLALGGPAGAPVLYVADTGNNRVVSLPVSALGTSSPTLTPVAGTSTAGAPVPGTATSSPLTAPQGVAWDPVGSALYIADTGNNQVEKVVAGTLSVVAGTGSATPGAQTPGLATASRLNAPRDVATDPAGHLYIADTGNGAVEVVSGTQLTTLTTAASPLSVATDGTTLFVGTGTSVVAAPVSGGAASAVATGLTAPEGLAVTTTGTAYVGDAAGSASRLVVLSPTGVAAAPLITSAAPTSAAKGVALSRAFTASGFPQPTWSIVGTPPASVTGLSIGTTSGLLTGTPTTSGPVTFTVRASNAQGHDDQVVTLAVGSVPAAVSAKPTASAGQGSATATWTAPTPSTAAGEAVTGYVVTPTCAGTPGAPRSVPASALSATFSGLKAGVACSFTVAATNAFGTAAPSPASAAVTPYGGIAGPGPGLTRYQGSNRVLTAVTTSQQLFPDAGSARAVVVASSTSYADSLAGARLAAAVGAPLLLTDPLALNPEVAAEVARVLAVPAAPSTSPVALAAADATTTAPTPTATGTVYLLGGTTAVSAATEAALKAVSSKYTVTRLSGADRYETAVKIAAQTAVDDPVPGAPVYVASGADYPDGLAVAALASRTGGVVLLTQGSTMPAATLAYLQTYDPNSELLVAVGGPAAAATAGHGGDRAIVGADRYDTARLVAARFTAQPGAPRVDDVGLATGTNWPDALAGAAAMGNLDGPLLLTPPDSLSPAVAPALQALSTAGRPTSALVFGGPSVVSPSAADAFAARVAG